MIKIRKVLCECCNEEFDSGRDEEDKLEEMRFLFGELPAEEKATVCEPCFIKIMEHNEIEECRYLPFLEKDQMKKEMDLEYEQDKIIIKQIRLMVKGYSLARSTTILTTALTMQVERIKEKKDQTTYLEEVARIVLSTSSVL